MGLSAAMVRVVSVLIRSCHDRTGYASRTLQLKERIRIGKQLAKDECRIEEPSCYNCFTDRAPSESKKMRHVVISRIVVIAGLLALAGCSKSATPGTTTTSPTGNSDSAGVPTPGGDSSASSPASTPSPQPALVVRAGTMIVVTAEQAVSSMSSNPGDRFDASLAAPVRINGEEIIPSGARATGTVTDAKSAGKFKGHAEITVALSSITVQGQHYSVRTSSVTEVGKGRGKRTAVGAGGRRCHWRNHWRARRRRRGGAAIGAGAGAGAGTAGAAFTGGRDIEIGAETRLSFRLKEPLEISGE